jgi:hypothetical protein
LPAASGPPSAANRENYLHHYLHTYSTRWSASGLARDGRYERAARLLGASHTALQTMGGQGSFNLFDAAHQRCVARVRDALGDDAYASALRHGAELGFDEAAAYALGEPSFSALIRETPSTNGADILTRREDEVAELITQGIRTNVVATQ